MASWLQWWSPAPTDDLEDIEEIEDAEWYPLQEVYYDDEEDFEEEEEYSDEEEYEDEYAYPQMYQRQRAKSIAVPHMRRNSRRRSSMAPVPRLRTLANATDEVQLVSRRRPSVIVAAPELRVETVDSPPMFRKRRSSKIIVPPDFEYLTTDPNQMYRRQRSSSISVPSGRRADPTLPSPAPVYRRQRSSSFAVPSGQRIELNPTAGPVQMHPKRRRSSLVVAPPGQGAGPGHHLALAGTPPIQHQQRSSSIAVPAGQIRERTVSSHIATPGSAEVYGRRSLSIAIPRTDQGDIPHHTSGTIPVNRRRRSSVVAAPLVQGPDISRTQGPMLEEPLPYRRQRTSSFAVPRTERVESPHHEPPIVQPTHRQRPSTSAPSGVPNTNIQFFSLAKQPLTGIQEETSETELNKMPSSGKKTHFPSTNSSPRNVPQNSPSGSSLGETRETSNHLLSSENLKTSDPPALPTTTMSSPISKEDDSLTSTATTSLPRNSTPQDSASSSAVPPQPQRPTTATDPMHQRQTSSSITATAPPGQRTERTQPNSAQEPSFTEPSQKQFSEMAKSSHSTVTTSNVSQDSIPASSSRPRSRYHEKCVAPVHSEERSDSALSEQKGRSNPSQHTTGSVQMNRKQRSSISAETPHHTADTSRQRRSSSISGSSGDKSGKTDPPVTSVAPSQPSNSTAHQRWSSLGAASSGQGSEITIPPLLTREQEPSFTEPNKMPSYEDLETADPSISSIATIDPENFPESSNTTFTIPPRSPHNTTQMQDQQSSSSIATPPGQQMEEQPSFTEPDHLSPSESLETEEFEAEAAAYLQRRHGPRESGPPPAVHSYSPPRSVADTVQMHHRPQGLAVAPAPPQRMARSRQRSGSRFLGRVKRPSLIAQEQVQFVDDFDSAEFDGHFAPPVYGKNAMTGRYQEPQYFYAHNPSVLMKNAATQTTASLYMSHAESSDSTTASKSKMRDTAIQTTSSVGVIHPKKTAGRKILTASKKRDIAIQTASTLGVLTTKGEQTASSVTNDTSIPTTSSLGMVMASGPMGFTAVAGKSASTPYETIQTASAVTMTEPSQPMVITTLTEVSMTAPLESGDTATGVATTPVTFTTVTQQAVSSPLETNGDPSVQTTSMSIPVPPEPNLSIMALPGQSHNSQTTMVPSSVTLNEHGGISLPIQLPPGAENMSISLWELDRLWREFLAHSLNEQQPQDMSLPPYGELNQAAIQNSPSQRSTAFTVPHHLKRHSHQNQQSSKLSRLTLQEALRQLRPDFIRECERRQRELKRRQELRPKAQLSANSSFQSIRERNSPRIPPHPLSNAVSASRIRPKIPPSKMYHNSKKYWSKLPEVQQRDKMKMKQSEAVSNRLRMKAYQQEVLVRLKQRGQRNNMY